MQSTPRCAFVPLADGRRLAYYEFGDRAGVPCVYTPGWPASGLSGAFHTTAAQHAGVRWIAVDKPGTGASDPDPRRSLSRYAADVRGLADHLGLERFAVVGESAGGPHALAAAHELPHRITTAVALASAGAPDTPGGRRAVTPTARLLLRMARRCPWPARLRAAQLQRALHHPARARRWVAGLRHAAPEADQQAWERLDVTTLLSSARGAFTQGSRWVAQELVVLSRPWGFSLSGIEAPVEVWHGTQDTAVPLSAARALAARIPGCTTRIFDGEGRCLGVSRPHELMRAIRNAASDDATAPGEKTGTPRRTRGAPSAR
ncbi:alpha/beta fold hydrolase [Salinifilum ghardaiensis]